jgi:DinB family protein
MSQRITLLQRALELVPGRLSAISNEHAATRSGESKWSPKEELGHLLDSACNNHQRIVRAVLQENPAMPGYEQRAWVEMHGYQQRDWQELIELWTALNRQLLAAARGVPAAAWTRSLTVATSQPVTLQFVFEDYLDHMFHHLEHIGIEITDLRTATAAAD